MKIKEYVNLTGIRPEMLIALMAAQEAYRKRSAEVIITSALDGQHSATSLHYAGCAVDLRTRHLRGTQAQEIADELNAALGQQYDVIYEGNHIHIEYQPRYLP